MSRRIPRTPAFFEIILWPFSGISNCRTLWQTSLWATASAYVFTFRAVLSYPWTFIALFQAIFVLTRQQDLSTTADIPAPLFRFTHSVSSPSLVFAPPLCPKLSDRKCFTLFDFEQSAQTPTNCPSFLFHSESTGRLLLFVFSFFHKVSAVKEDMMSSGNYAANRVKAAWRWNTQQASQRDLLTLTTEISPTPLSDGF